MATGQIAALGPSSSVAYTPASSAKLALTCASTASGAGVKVNGAYVFYNGSNNYQTSLATDIFVGAGQTVTITTDATAACNVSTLESN
jgi:hypothetical protein